jgi:hypothetical protein
MLIEFKITSIIFIAILPMTTSDAEPERSKEEWQYGVNPLITYRAPRGTWSSVNKCTTHSY